MSIWRVHWNIKGKGYEISSWIQVAEVITLGPEPRTTVWRQRRVKVAGSWGRLGLATELATHGKVEIYCIRKGQFKGTQSQPVWVKRRSWGVGEWKVGGSQEARAEDRSVSGKLNPWIGFLFLLLRLASAVTWQETVTAEQQGWCRWHRWEPAVCSLGWSERSADTQWASGGKSQGRSHRKPPSWTGGYGWRFVLGQNAIHTS